MESALTNACKIRIRNFEGPFDLLFHLIEKNQFNIYDIPINDITDQYMEYLAAMQELDLEIASEFLVTAATLLHIKSKMLLPDVKEKREEEVDPREELVLRLVEYKRYKEFSRILREKESQWEKAFYKLPERIGFEWEEPVYELSLDELKRVYREINERNKRRMNRDAGRIEELIQREKVSLKNKMKEILMILINKAFFRFSEIFPLGKKSKAEVVTGFMAVLELAKLHKVNLDQKKRFSEIYVRKAGADMGKPREDADVGAV